MVQHPSNGDASGHPADQPAGRSAGGPSDHPVSGGSSRARAARAADAADRLSKLTHELSGLLDGSLRWIGLAERNLPRVEGPLSDEVEKTRKQLETVKTALVRMSDLVSDATESGRMGSSLGGVSRSGGQLGVTLGEAIDHAADVLRPRATELGISIRLELENQAGRLPAGPMYSVILNGLRNAVDSIARSNAGRPGEGEITARLVSGPHNDVVMEIIDDGAGLGKNVDPADVFRADFSSRPGGGIGLALAKEIVDEVCGRIELIRRAEGPRGGAVLRVTWSPGIAGERRGMDSGHG